VAADAAADTYAAIHLHFASPTPRSLLEELASETVKTDCMGKLACVFDEYLDFLTLERGMFSLGMPKTYVRLNDPSAQDTDVEVRAAYPLLPRSLRLPDPPHVGAPAQLRHQSPRAHGRLRHTTPTVVGGVCLGIVTQHTSTHIVSQTDDGGGATGGRRGVRRQAAVSTMVDGLFAMLVTLGQVPYIRCPRGGAAEMVAAHLNKRLADHLVTRNNLFTEAGAAASFQRPLLCLFDRNFELAVAVQHVWTYQPLVHDVLGLTLNRTTVTVRRLLHVSAPRVRAP